MLKKTNIQTLVFQKSDFNLTGLATNTTTYTKTQELPTYKLINCLFKLGEIKFIINNKSNKFKIENCISDNLDNIYKELYKRIIIPLYLPVLILIALLAVMKSKENINYFKYRLLIFFTGLLLVIFSETTIRFIQDTFFENVKIIILPILIMIILYSLFIYNFRSKLKANIN